MGLYSTYKTDESLETEGVVLTFGKNDSGKTIGFKVARAGGANKAFTRVLTAKTRPYRRQIEQGTLPNETMEALLAEVYADTVLLAWENVEGPDGKEMEFNRGNIIKLFTDLPDLFADIRAGATEISSFRADILDAVVKN